MDRANTALIGSLRKSFAAHADAAKARAMQTYMKSAVPFWGLQAPMRRALTAAAVKAYPCADRQSLHDTMATLWRSATRREERYAAQELARTGAAHRRLRGLHLLPLYEEMIVTGAWWDFCDEISSAAIGPLLCSDRAAVETVLRRWSVGDDLWLRRAAIICQRKLVGDAFDAKLMIDCILPSIGDSPFAREFFIRKGIGWALRSRSYAAPDEVRAFCAEYADRLAPLTRREALRVIERAPQR